MCGGNKRAGGELGTVSCTIDAIKSSMFQGLSTKKKSVSHDEEQENVMV